MFFLELGLEFIIFQVDVFLLPGGLVHCGCFLDQFQLNGVGLSARKMLTSACLGSAHLGLPPHYPRISPVCIDIHFKLSRGFPLTWLSIAVIKKKTTLAKGKLGGKG